MTFSTFFSYIGIIMQGVAAILALAVLLPFYLVIKIIGDDKNDN